MLQLFIARSTALGFLVNDIFDRALDSYESRTRNPLTERTCHLFAVNASIRVPLLHSLICPGVLRARLALAGEVGLFIFATSSPVGSKQRTYQGLTLPITGCFPHCMEWWETYYTGPGFPHYCLFLFVFIFGAVFRIFLIKSSLMIGTGLLVKTSLWLRIMSLFFCGRFPGPQPHQTHGFRLCRQDQRS